MPRYYDSREWKQLREAALLRDLYRCAVPGCRARATHVDHIVSRRMGGPDTLANLRSLCAMEADDKVQYSSWVQEGFIEALPGRAIDKQAVVIRLAEIAGQYDLRGLAFDEWRFSDIQKLLDDEGIELPLRKTRQGYKSMSPCVDALEIAVLNRSIRHDSNPPLSMCIANAVVTMDAAGNRKIDKARSRARVDGAVCLAMALGLKATEPEPIELDFDRPLVLGI